MAVSPSSAMAPAGPAPGGLAPETHYRILFRFRELTPEELPALLAGVEPKVLRWLASHHPDNHTRKHILRLSGVRIGRGAVINPNLMISDGYQDLVRIGARASIAPNVTIIAQSGPNNSRLADHPFVRERLMKDAPVVIEDDAWIGANVTLLPGVSVGARSVIGAGSVVTRDIPADAVAAGVPCAVIRRLTGEQPSVPWITPGPPEVLALQEALHALHGHLRSAMREAWDRSLPFEELLFDRWERARSLGFGEGTSIYHNSYVYGDVKVGRHTWIGPYTLLDGSSGLTIGDHCSISSGVKLFTHDTVRWALTGGRAPYEHAPVRIGNCCYLGTDTVVAKGVTIGDHCLVAVSSFVKSDLPPYSIAGGTPCRILGTVEVDGETVRLRYTEKERAAAAGPFPLGGTSGR